MAPTTTFHKKLTWIALAALTGGIGISLGLLVASNGSEGRAQVEAESPFQTVPGELLDAARVVLLTPGEAETSKATVSLEVARGAVLERAPGLNVVESKLLHFRDIGPTPNFECLCWVFVVDYGVPAYIGAPEAIDKSQPVERFVPDGPAIALELVDAFTGKYLYSVQATGTRSEWEDPVTGDRYRSRAEAAAAMAARGGGDADLP